MAKTTKRPVKNAAKSTTKKSPKKAVKKPAKKQTAVKSSPAPKKGAGIAPAHPKPAAVKKAVPDDETRKVPAAKGSPAMPNDPDLDEEEMGEEEIEVGGESEMDEDMEEDLSLDDDDEEDVDYLEKSDDLIDDSDDYRH